MFPIDPRWRAKIASLRRRLRIAELIFTFADNAWTMDQGYGGCAVRAEKENKKAAANLGRMKLTARERSWIARTFGQLYLDQVDRGG